MTREDEIKNQKVKKLYVGVIILLIVMFVALFALSLNKVLAMEGAFPDKFTPLAESEIPEPAQGDAADFLRLLDDGVDKALAEKPKLRVTRSFSIDSPSSDGSAQLDSTLAFVSGSVEKLFEERFGELTSDFGGDISAALKSPELTPDDVLAEIEKDGEAAPGFTCTYKFYRCASCGAESPDPRESCELCGYSYPYSLKYRDEYTVEMHLNPSEKIRALFGDMTGDEIASAAADELDSVASIKDVDAQISDYAVVFRVDRITGKLNYMEFRKQMKVTAELAFTGAFAELGEAETSADVTSRERYEFTWPGISLNRDVLILEPGKSDNLLATLTCDDPAAKIKITDERGKEVETDKYPVLWEISDDSVASLEKGGDGYFRAAKDAEGKSAVVTASFEFNGVKYTDVCEVLVRYSVQSMKLSDRKLKLSAGETATLSAKVYATNSLFSFDRATVETVGHWTSSAPEVASVDENGVVTALSPGTATVSVYSDDGFYMSTCEVTVK